MDLWLRVYIAWKWMAYYTMWTLRPVCANTHTHEFNGKKAIDEEGLSTLSDLVISCISFPRKHTHTHMGTYYAENVQK